MCVETVLTDETKVWDNVKDAKLKSPDYKGMTPEEAMEVRERTSYFSEGASTTPLKSRRWLCTARVKLPGTD